MTVFVAVRFSAHPSNPLIVASSAASVSARAASSRADCAASPSDSARAAGGDAATARTDCGGLASAAIGRKAEASTGADGASRFDGSSPIASSAPISTYQRNSARAASVSAGFDFSFIHVRLSFAMAAVPRIKRRLWSVRLDLGREIA